MLEVGQHVHGTIDLETSVWVEDSLRNQEIATLIVASCARAAAAAARGGGRAGG